MGIDILLDETYSNLGILKYITWYPEKAPHMIVVGATGSGKTYFCKLLLGKLSLYEKHSKIYVLDFKGDEDFNFLSNSEQFYRYSDCTDGLQTFYNRFQARQSGED